MGPFTKGVRLIIIFVFIALLFRGRNVTGRDEVLPGRDIQGSTTSSPAAISTINPATPTDLALAMGVPAGDIVTADLMGSDTSAVGVSTAQLGPLFPTEGNSFAILATGKAADGERPNTEGNLTTQLGGIDNNQGNDLVRLHLQLKVPSTINCMNIDFAFYSEEFPEYVGSQYNDAFTAQLNDSSISIDVNNKVVAPSNFAFDSLGNVISVSTVYGVSSSSGTTYDGATPLLRASTAVLPDATIDVYLSIQDVGDSSYDSAVFLDRFFWSKDPNCSTGAAVDTDGDGLLDEWEKNGLNYSVGGVNEFIDLPTMGAKPDHRDIFVEIDYMETVGHSHRPLDNAILEITASFDRAPVSNPDGTTGIHLHVDYGPNAPLSWNTGNIDTWGTLSRAESLTEQVQLGTCQGTNYNWTAFDAIKQAHFSAGRAAVFHYNVWAHNLCPSLGNVSGISRIAPTGSRSGSSDLIVSLGSWDNSIGSFRQQAGTFMHELGHNLGLDHGGEDNINHKPNYLSIMNYSFVKTGLYINGFGARFDYSRYDLPDLNENSLDETAGIQIPSGITDKLGTIYFCALDDSRVVEDASTVDWNCDGNVSGVVSKNINQGLTTSSDSNLGILKSQTDWDKLVYFGGAIGALGASFQLPMDSVMNEIDLNTYNQLPVFPSKLFLPLAIRSPNAGVGAIHGLVNQNGSPAAGVGLELRFWNGSTWSTLDSTVTAANGTYQFTNPPSLGSGQVYYVRFLNDENTAGRLWFWGTTNINSYLSGSDLQVENFDIADLQLVSPVDGSTIFLPATFQWIRRTATPSDNYEFNLYDPADQNPWWWTNPTLGYVSNYTLTNLPPGFSINTGYVWDIWIYGPTGGYGISYNSFGVAFSNTGFLPFDQFRMGLEKRIGDFIFR